MQWIVTDLDEAPGERSCRIVQEPFRIDLAYQESDAASWALVVLVYCLDTVIGNAERVVPAGLTDDALTALARELLPEAATKAASALETLQEGWRALTRELLCDGPLCIS
jgi:hypothetical protein